MKILNQNFIYSIRANSTNVFANSTTLYANTTTFSLVDNIHLIPRRAEHIVNVQIKDEIKDLIVNTIGYLKKDKESYVLSFESVFPFVNDNQFEIILTSQNDDDVVIYRGKMLVTDQQPQKFKY